MKIDRRTLLRLLAASGLGTALDVDRLLWEPGKKVYFDLWTPERKFGFWDPAMAALYRQGMMTDATDWFVDSDGVDLASEHDWETLRANVTRHMRPEYGALVRTVQDRSKPRLFP